MTTVVVAAFPSSGLAVTTAAASSPPAVIEDGATRPVLDHASAIREVVYVEAPMDSDHDGANDRIAVDVIRPVETRQGMRVPTIMEASPYYGVSFDPAPDGTKGFPGWWDEYFVPRGYAVVQPEMQGTGRSFGCPTTGGVEDTTSIEAVVDWLNGRAPAYHHDGTPAVASWSTGNVGMQGVSYDGTLPNAVATQGIRGLRTVVPIAAISSWYRYVNDQGIAWNGWRNRYTEFLAGYVSRSRDLPGSASAPACGPAITALGDAEIAANANFMPFWQERSYLPDANKIKTTGTSVFMVHGLTDDNVKTMQFADLWQEVEARQMPRKIWLHRGGHLNPVSFRQTEWQAVMHRWMDHWLYDIPNGVMNDPMADIQRPDGTWETHSAWPDAGASKLKMRFGPAGPGAAGTLSLKAPAGDPRQSFVDKVQPQADKIANPEEALPGRLVYVTPSLSRSVRISGIPEVRVRMSTSTTSSLLSALLVDYGEGQTVSVSGREPLELIEASCNPMDLAERTGCAERPEVSAQASQQRVLAWGHIDAKNHADLRQDQDLVPGQEHSVRWTMLPSEHIVAAGHRIGLVITGNYLASPANYRPQPDTTSLDSQVTLHLNDGQLTLPVVGGRSAFDW